MRITCLPDVISNFKLQVYTTTSTVFSPIQDSTINISFTYAQLLTYATNTSVHFNISIKPVEL